MLRPSSHVEEVLEVAAIGRHRVLRQVALAGRIGHEGLEPRLRHGRAAASAAEGGAVGGGVVAMSCFVSDGRLGNLQRICRRRLQLAQPLLKGRATSLQSDAAALSCDVDAVGERSSPRRLCGGHARSSLRTIPNRSVRAASSPIFPLTWRANRLPRTPQSLTSHAPHHAHRHALRNVARPGGRPVPADDRQGGIEDQDGQAVLPRRLSRRRAAR